MQHSSFEFLVLCPDLYLKMIGFWNSMPGSPFLYWLDSGWILSRRVFLTPKMGWLFGGWKWIGYFAGPQPKLWIRLAVVPSWVGRVTRTQSNVHVPFLNSMSVCPSPSIHVNTFGLETSAFSASQKNNTQLSLSHTHSQTHSYGRRTLHGRFESVTRLSFWFRLSSW